MRIASPAPIDLLGPFARYLELCFPNKRAFNENEILYSLTLPLRQQVVPHMHSCNSSAHQICTAIACPCRKIPSAPHTPPSFHATGMLAQVRKDSGEDAFAREFGARIDGGDVVGPPPRRVRPRRLHST
eukprot:2545102-Prymnesium_polylepis.1